MLSRLPNLRRLRPERPVPRLAAAVKTPNGSGRSARVPVNPASLAQDLEGLTALPLDQLRVQFRNRTGRIAPTRISRPLLLRVLAYRLQADIFGDLRPETRRMLERTAAGRTETTEADQGDNRSALASAEARMKPRTGTVLVREWQGRMQRVTVSEAGYDWNAISYLSLSAVATAITGTKWNGRRFFGLDQASAKKAKVKPRSVAAVEVMTRSAHAGATP